MASFSLHQIAHNLKAYVKSWDKNELLFSYDLKIASTKTETTLSLYQKETNFSIFMDWQEQKHCLRITHFAMTEDQRLEELSDALYDAAIVELVLQSLNLVFYCAVSQDQEEAVFVLTDEEAEHLNIIKSCFNDVSSHTTIDG